MTFDPLAWKPDAHLVRELEDQYTRTIESYRAHPNLISEHANHEESIRTGGYATRTLLELTQNGADAMAGASLHDAGEAPGRIEIVLDATNQVLYCANAGRPFSVSGVTAITMAHLSAKRGDEIGRFGLGFKSVLAVSQKPEVFSRSVAFEFGSAAARQALATVAKVARQPILRTATVVDAVAAFEKDPILAELAEWATTIVRLPGAANLDRLREEIEEFHSEFLLFVEAVREARLRVVGDDRFETRHVSRDLGEGHMRIERPDGSGEEWYVESRMHSPSAAARKEVGEAVSRSEVKVTVALPAMQSDRRTGEFWSYFPLQDTTSASGLFNAPWSVNDDRTTLLRNDYNREMLRAVSEMFVDLLPRARRSDDAAAHLDYMPARGREVQSFGDELLIVHVPQIAAAVALIPNARGELRHGSELTPLDFSVSFEPEVHRGWIHSPNTGGDVPHWRCYSTRQRATRLRDLFLAGVAPELEAGRHDQMRALERLPHRGVLSWLREWAEGDDPQSAANALQTVIRNPLVEGIDGAKVIPTTDGMRALSDRAQVFLSREADLEIEGSAFVLPAFLAYKDVEETLRSRGFGNLDPQAILTARLSKITSVAGDEEYTKLWDAALNLSVHVAAGLLKQSMLPIKVPTLDGGWAWPRQVFDLDLDLGAALASSELDRSRCVPDVAHQLGVVRAPVKGFSFEDEPLAEQYRDWVRSILNEARGPGERAIEKIELTPGEGPGPFSGLLLLRDAGAPAQNLEAWTNALLMNGDEDWTCEDLDTGRTYAVRSPARWAVDVAGKIRTSRGYRAPHDTVAPSLLRYDGLLPLFSGPRQVAAVLGLPDELESVPPQMMADALDQSGLVPSTVRDDVLIEFVLAASRIGFPGARPRLVPARVRRVIEAREPSAVFIATTDEQEEYLRTHDLPFLRATEDLVDALVETVGCCRFEDSFSFSIIIDGRSSGEPILDRFTGLRNSLGSERLKGATVSRAQTILKRVTTEQGVEDQVLDRHLAGLDVVVPSDADDRQTLRLISEDFGLRLDNAQIEAVLKAGQAHHLEAMRLAAQTIETDAERLEHYIGPDDLRDTLPTGLWSALAAQGLVDESTPLGKLFLTVYGADALRELADRFRNDGWSDVPIDWAGTPSAISWVRRMGFGAEYAGQRPQFQPEEFVVPGAVRLPKLHSFQKHISEKLRVVLTQRSDDGRAHKGMVELPTGAGKTRVATETALKLFSDEVLSGTILWIAQSIELCEQAVKTFETVWRSLDDERPLTIGRLWQGNTVHQPDTELSVVVATDAQLDSIREKPEYEWLSRPAAVFIDEAHRAGGSKRYTRILHWLGVDGHSWKRPLVGLSATPFKGHASDGAQTEELARRFGGNRLDGFEEGVNAYQELVKLGVLASVQHEILRGVRIDFGAVEQGDSKSRPLIDRGLYERIGRDEARMKILVEHILEQDPYWPILVFTPSVLSAQVLAASLRYRGRTAESVSGQTGRQQRRNVIKRFQKGEIQILANCDLLIQGFDAPGVRALYIARPTFSPSAYIQMAGRGLRGKANGGSEECLIVDVADNWGAMNDFLGYHEYKDLWKKQG